MIERPDVLPISITLGVLVVVVALLVDRARRRKLDRAETLELLARVRRVKRSPRYLRAHALNVLDREMAEVIAEDWKPSSRLDRMLAEINAHCAEVMADPFYNPTKMVPVELPPPGTFKPFKPSSEMADKVAFSPADRAFFCKRCGGNFRATVADPGVGWLFSLPLQCQSREVCEGAAILKASTPKSNPSYNHGMPRDPR